MALLDSQFATLQEPTGDEHPIIVDIDRPPAGIVTEILRRLKARGGHDGRTPEAAAARMGKRQ